MDGKALPKGRWRMDLGNLIISNLRRIDFGYYECHMSNEVATLVATTHLVIEGTTPHAPYNITTESTEFSIKLEWLPGYSGGSDYSQNYEVRSVRSPTWTRSRLTPLIPLIISLSFQPLFLKIFNWIYILLYVILGCIILLLLLLLLLCNILRSWFRDELGTLPSNEFTTSFTSIPNHVEFPRQNIGPKKKW